MKFPNSTWSVRKCLRAIAVILACAVVWMAMVVWFMFSRRTFAWRQEWLGEVTSLLLLNAGWVPCFVGVCALIGVWRVRDREFAPGMCGYCGYDLHGLSSETCPECGKELSR